jgi:hypothetical protein
MSVRIRRDVCDAIAFSDSHRLQYRRPAIATLQELPIREPQLSIDHRFSIGVETARPAREFHWSERYFHRSASEL